MLPPRGAEAERRELGWGMQRQTGARGPNAAAARQDKVRALRCTNLRGIRVQPSRGASLRKGAAFPASRAPRRGSPACFGGQSAPPGGIVGNCARALRASRLVAKMERWGGFTRREKTKLFQRLKRNSLHLVVPRLYFMNTIILRGASMER